MLKFAYFTNSKWRATAILKMKNLQYLCNRPTDRDEICSLRCRIYSGFFISNMAAVRHCEFLKNTNFYFLHGLRWQSAYSCKISSRFVERLRRYCKLSTFIMAFARHFEFVKYANFNITHCLQSKSAYLYKISSRSVERLWKYRDFQIPNMASFRHFELLKYANFHILNALQ